MNLKNNNGVTILALAITIIVLLVLAGVATYSGMNTIRSAQLENLKTDMLLIQAKAKEYVEEVNFKKGVVEEEQKTANARNDIYTVKAKLVKLSEAPDEVKTVADKVGLPKDKQNYYVPEEALKSMGLNQVHEGEGNYYIISFDESNMVVEIYNTDGFKNGDTKIYSLTEIDKIQ